MRGPLYEALGSYAEGLIDEAYRDAGVLRKGVGMGQWCAVHGRDKELVLATHMVDDEAVCQSCCDAMGEKGTPLSAETGKPVDPPAILGKRKCEIQACTFPAAKDGDFCTYRHSHYNRHVRKQAKAAVSQPKVERPAPAPRAMETMPPTKEKQPSTETVTLTIPLSVLDQVWASRTPDEKARLVELILSGTK